jgi:dipeptidyl aminopeptidase/acylaminoacyl peptidase
VVSWAGISDLPKMLKADRSDGKDSPAYQYELREIGDPDADKATLLKSSPISYAADFAPAVLLVHGEDDTTVPADQSRDMEKALKRAHHAVRLILVKGEDHRDWDTDNLTATMESVAAFITAHTAAAP